MNTRRASRWQCHALRSARTELRELPLRAHRGCCQLLAYSRWAVLWQKCRSLMEEHHVSQSAVEDGGMDYGGAAVLSPLHLFVWMCWSSWLDDLDDAFVKRIMGCVNGFGFLWWSVFSVMFLNFSTAPDYWQSSGSVRSSTPNLPLVVLSYSCYMIWPTTSGS